MQTRLNTVLLLFVDIFLLLLFNLLSFMGLYNLFQGCHFWCYPLLLVQPSGCIPLGTYLLLEPDLACSPCELVTQSCNSEFTKFVFHGYIYNYNMKCECQEISQDSHLSLLCSLLVIPSYHIPFGLVNKSWFCYCNM